MDAAGAFPHWQHLQLATPAHTTKYRIESLNLTLNLSKINTLCHLCVMVHTHASKGGRWPGLLAPLAGAGLARPGGPGQAAWPGQPGPGQDLLGLASLLAVSWTLSWSLERWPGHNHYWLTLAGLGSTMSVRTT